jgi:hypothetical protein
VGSVGSAAEAFDVVGDLPGPGAGPADVIPEGKLLVEVYAEPPGDPVRLDRIKPGLNRLREPDFRLARRKILKLCLLFGK